MTMLILAICVGMCQINIYWGIGHWAWGIGHWALGMGHIGERFTATSSPIPNAQR